jgi:hypothetical protein
VLISGTEYVDSSGGQVGIDAGGSGGGSSYYGVSSVDDSGDESAQSLGVSPATSGASAGGGGGCFIDSVAQPIPYRYLWLLGFLLTGVLVGKRFKASRRTDDRGQRTDNRRQITEDRRQRAEP